MTQYGFGSIPQILTSNGSGIIPSFQSLTQPGVMNLGIAQTSGTTFTVQGANGTALSASNPAYVTLQSLANPGQLKTYKVIANQSFTQANISANTWGITSGVNWAMDMPFFIYAVSNAQNGENTIAFMISRIPHAISSPVAGKIAKQGSAVATTQGSFYCLPNVTVADYATSPSLLIGSFRMQYAAAGTNWTIQTLNNGDGIGEFSDTFGPFAMPTGQFGAASGKFIQNNGGTAPSWLNQSFGYSIQKNGMCKALFLGNGGNADGAGNVNVILPVPIANVTNIFGIGYYNAAGTPTIIHFGSNSSGFQVNNTLFFVGTGGSGTLQNVNFSAAADLIGNLYYPISTS